MRRSLKLLALFFWGLLAGQAQAAFHLWQMNELYSSADGTVQFLEITALSGGQQFLAGHTLVASSGGNTRSFTFPSNLPGDTAGKRMLIGTQSFAALSVVQPDFVVPDGFFFNAGGTINFAEFSDVWNHPAAPTPPLSRNRDGSTATNSPMNFAGQSGSVSASFTLTVDRTGSGSGSIASSPAGINCPTTCAADFPQGSQVTLSASANAGSTFSGWSGGGCSGTGNCAVTLSAATSVTATFTLSPIATTTTLSGPASSMFGSTVTFAATVGASSGTPTGSVTFKDGAATLCNAVALVSAQAQCATSSLSAGTHSITAQYSGSASHAASTSSTLSHSVVQGTFLSVTVNKAGTGSGTVTSSPDGIHCGTTCNAAFADGTVVTLTASAAGGSTFAGWSGGGCGGTGTCQVTTNATVTATFDAPNPPRLANISTRMQVLTGGDVMIAGLIIGGPTAKTVVVNVAGPSLANFGVMHPLANPTLTLVRQSDNAIIGTNDNWQTQANPADVSAITDSGFQPNNALEPALIATLAPGAYTAIVEGANGGTGVGLIGVFEVDHPEVPFINISTRGKVLTNEDVMIAGFIVQGDSAKTVVVNVAGPSLANFGIANPLANPQLTIVRSSDNVIIATNDNWQTQANSADVAAIQATGFQPNHTLEPAVILTLPPGGYTAIVTGGNSGTGVALVGVFAVQ
jgi:hypothetical protein